MTEVQNTAFETMSAQSEHPPINNTAILINKPKKSKAKAVSKHKKPTAPRVKKPTFETTNTLSKECVDKRKHHISVCQGCGGHRVCEKCVVKHELKLPQTFNYPDTDPDVNSEDEDFDMYAKYRLPPQAVVKEYVCRRWYDDDRARKTCHYDNVEELPCTLCLEMGDEGPTETTWVYNSDLGMIVNEMSLCPGCMVDNPEEICTVCHYDMRHVD
jgi:hypothetical protein